MTDDFDPEDDYLFREFNKLNKRLDALDVGCSNCGGLPHTIECQESPQNLKNRLEDEARLTDRLAERLKYARRVLGQAHVGEAVLRVFGESPVKDIDKDLELYISKRP